MNLKYSFKKITACTLLLFLTLSLFTGCQKNEKQEIPENEEEKENSEEEFFELIIAEIIPKLMTDTKLREHPAGY